MDIKFNLVHGDDISQKKTIKVQKTIMYTNKI